MQVNRTQVNCTSNSGITVRTDRNSHTNDNIEEISTVFYEFKFGDLLEVPLSRHMYKTVLY